jgi:hypothetical protein
MSFLDLVQSMTKIDPAERPTIDQVRASVYMQEPKATHEQIAELYVGLKLQ